MKTQIKKENGRTMITLEGNLDTINSALFSTDIQSLLNDNEPDIIVDCKKLDYISSSGLRMLMMLQKSVTKNNGQLVFKSVSPAVLNVFSITGFTKILTIK